MSPRCHVLLVDDDRDHILLTRRVLERRSPAAEVDAVEDGESAIEYLRAHADDTSGGRPGLVVLDLNLPRMNGLDVLRAIKRDAHLRDIPVVIVSSQFREQDAARAHDLGASAVLSKSAGPEAISDALGTLGFTGPRPFR